MEGSVEEEVVVLKGGDVVASKAEGVGLREEEVVVLEQEVVENSEGEEEESLVGEGVVVLPHNSVGVASEGGLMVGGAGLGD